MFKTFYQLSAEPFRLSPDSRFCFPHPSYRKAIIYMRHAIQRGEGFIMITGRPGTGKTTIIQHLLRMLKPGQIVVAKLVTAQLTADDLLRLVAYSFNLNPEGSDKAKLLIQVERFLKQQYQQGRRALLIVDEAQDMAEEALEELRLLTNIQVGVQQLLQIFLVGQEQLRNVVIAPSLEQLQQRMIAATHLEPLDANETKDYIKYRLRRVNWSGDPLFSNEAYTMIHRYSRGVPRQINQICNRLLLHGGIERKHRLGLADVRIVVEELHHELLLSMEKVESSNVVPWPTDLPTETYQEEPDRQRTSPAAVLTPETANGTAHGEQAAEWQGKARPKPPATATVASASEVAVESQLGSYQRINSGKTVELTSIVAAHRDKVDGNHPVPPQADTAPSHGIARKHDNRKRSSLAILGSTLLAVLLLALMYATHPDMIRAASHTLSSWVSTGVPRLHSSTNPKLPQQHATVSRQDINTGTVLRSPPAVTNAPATRELDSAVPKAPPDEPEPRTVGQEPVQAEPQAELLELEAELSRKGLLVERLEDNSLKVRLSSDGIFDVNSAQLRNSAGPSLEELAGVLRNHDQMKLRIVGHTDSSGEYDYNLHLSEIRAKAVADQLIKLGLPAADIQSVGRGDLDTRNEILSSNKSSLKRRVEIYIR